MRTGALHKLTAKQVQHAKSGMHSDGGGLFLAVKGGGRSWVFRYTQDKRKREMGLGSLSSVSLSSAREAAANARQAVAEGRDPIDARQQSFEMPEPSRAIFRAAMERFLRLNGPTWKNAKHAAQWRSTLVTYAAPLMEMDVATITSREVLDCLEPIWNEKPETARRVRGRIERVLSSCIALSERQPPNPAGWKDNLEHLLTSKRPRVKHHAAIPVEEAPAAFSALWARRDKSMGAQALCFAILGAMRSGEVRQLQHSDLKQDHVAIPAERMKASVLHRVPLLPEMIAPPKINGADLVFPSSRLRPLSDMTLAKAQKSAEIGGTPHGWRSTFSDWANGAGYRREYIEDALAHQIGSAVERAYRRNDYLEQRRPMMEAWRDYLLAR